MDNYFDNEFSSQLLCETVTHPNISVGTFSYYSGYHHGHSFEHCVRYLDKKRKDIDRLIIGNPAKVIKYRFSHDKIKKLLSLKWWNWSESKVKENMELLCSEGISTIL